MTVDKIVLAAPRGFCAGVEMSIKSLIWLMYSCKNRRTYCYHEIVHNNVVVNWFQNRGVRFINSLDEIPYKYDKKVALMLSAHGTDPNIEEKARKRFDIVVNSACPLVTKVHNEVKSSNQSASTIIYFGNPSHDEGQGVIGASNKDVHCINSPLDVDDLPEFEGKDLRFLSQTTESFEAWTDIYQKLSKRYGQVTAPKNSDLCFATTNRQKALRQLAEKCNHLIIIGSRQSANTLSLFNIAKSICTSVQLVNDTIDIDMNIDRVVGITAGASAPETLVKQVCSYINPKNGIETLNVIDEKEYFRPPFDLRELEKREGVQKYYPLAEDKKIDVATLFETL